MFARVKKMGSGSVLKGAGEQTDWEMWHFTKMTVSSLLTTREIKLVEFQVMLFSLLIIWHKKLGEQLLLAEMFTHSKVSNLFDIKRFFVRKQDRKAF